MTDPAFLAFAGSGAWPGMPSGLADDLPEHGMATRDDVTTDRLARLPKISGPRAAKLMSSFVAAAPALELVEVLLAASVDPRVAGRAVDTMGRDVMRALRDDPWALLAVPTVDPDVADRVARALVDGVSREDPRRGRALVAHVLALDARAGHTVMARSDVDDALGPFGVGDRHAAVEAALASGRAVEVGGDELSPAALAEAEDVVAHSLARLTATAEAIRFDPKRAAVQRLDETQRGAVAAALAHGVSLLTGGPGTGKSATVAAIVDQCHASGIDVALAAPTGRAAKRLEELTEAEAATVHRLLGARARTREDDDTVGGSALPASARAARTWSAVEFDRGEDWPLDQQVVVVDEASMLDTELAAALLSACADGTHLVLVGDPAQLPSVGPGQVLADVLAAVEGREDVPTTELTTLYRQAEGGAIARLATSVRGGTLPPVETTPDHEVVLVATRTSAEAAHRVVQLVTDSIPRALGIPSASVQVVTPVHGGPAGTVALNNALKAVLNPSKSSGRQRFDVGDRVVATANHLEAEPNGFANGEVGSVTSVVSGTVTVEFSSGPAAVRGKVLADLAHGWAVTVHRAQGSEFPAVVVVLPPEAGRMLSRPLVYTALTRAQQHLSIVHAAGPAVARAVKQVGVQRRRTALAARIGVELAEL